MFVDLIHLDIKLAISFSGICLFREVLVRFLEEVSDRLGNKVSVRHIQKVWSKVFSLKIIL